MYLWFEKYSFQLLLELIKKTNNLEYKFEHIKKF